MQKHLLIIMLFAASYTHAQTTTRGHCETPEMDTTEFQNLPWYGNNDMLETFLDSIGYPSEVSTNRIIGRPQVRYWIPIKFWIYRDDNGNGGPTPVQIQRLMDDLNFRFNQNNNTMIGFYQKCEPSFINNSTHTEKQP